MKRFRSILGYLFGSHLCLLVALGFLSSSAFSQTSQYDRGTPPQLSTGIQPLGSYSLTELDTVNLANGNLNVAIPLITLGGRGGLTMPIVLAYNSKVWSNSRNVDPYNAENPPVVFGAQYRISDSADWRVVAAPSLKWTLVRITPLTHPTNGISLGWASALSKLTLELPGGGEITFRDDLTDGQPLAAQDPFPNDPYEFYSQDGNRGNTWHSVDGTGAIYISDIPNGAARGQLAGWVILADGTRYRFNGLSEPSTLTPDTQRAGWFEYAIDRNGNKITAITNGYQDQLGRTVTIQNNVPDPNNPSLTVNILITVNGYGGTPRYYKIYRSVMSAAYRSDYSPILPVVTGDYDPFFRPESTYPGPHTTLFYNSWFGGRIIVSDEYVTSQLTLPDNRSFTFRYNIFGELAEITNPLGGKVRYEYDSTTILPAGASLPSEGGVDIPDRVIIRRTTLPNGQNEAFYSYSYGSSMAEVKVCQGAVCGTGGASLLRWERHHYLPAQRYLAYGFGESAEGTGYSLWSTGLEWRTEILNTNSAVIQATEQDWVQRAPVGFVYGNPPEQPPNDNRRTQTRSYLDNGSFAKTEFFYDADPQRVRANNVTEVREYDFGQSNPTRRTVTDYLKNNPNNGNIDYTTSAIHQISLPTRQSVYEDVTEKARTVYEYDKYVSDGNNATLQDPGNATGHDSTYGTGLTTRGNSTAIGRWQNPGGPTLYSYSRYDKLGNVVSGKDPNGQVSTISYADNFGDGSNPDSGAGGTYGATFALPTLITSPAPNAGETAHTAKSQYDFSTGLLTGFKDRNGIKTKAEYSDPFNRPTRVISANGVAAVETHARMYYAPATLSQYNLTLSRSDVLTVKDQTTVSDSALRSWAVTDGFGRTTESWTRDPQGDVRVTALYDALGRAKQTSNPYRSGETPVYTTTNYDLAGRVTSVVTPDGATVATAYDGARGRVTDQAGKQRISETDAQGRLRKVWEVTSAGTDSVTFLGANSNSHLTQYSYDVLDNLTTATQGTQPPRTFAYDALKRLTSATNPESGLTGYTYDNNGNLRFKTDARNITTEITYDALNRAKMKTYSTTSSDPTVIAAVNATPTVNYYYDSQTPTSGLPAGFDRGKATGRLVAVLYSGASPGAGSYYGYDELGRAKQSIQRTEGQDYGLSYAYNRAGQMTSETYPSLRVIATNYDTAGRISGVQRAGAGWFYAEQFNYAAHGAPTAMKLGNKLWERMSFNSRLQVTEIKLGTETASDSVFKLNYLYGTVNNPTDPDGSIVATQNNGNLGRIKYTIGGTLQYSQTFQYDSLNRLNNGVEHNQGVPSNSVWWQKFAYDRWGNRGIDVPNSSANVTQSGTALQLADFSGTNNRITRSGYSYDNAGNLKTEAGGKSYSYDGENKMVTAVVAGATTNYAYDGDGRRVRKLSVGVTTVFVYNAAGQLIAEYTSSAPAYGIGGTKYLTADHLGSTRLVTSGGNGAVKARYDYLPFGEELGTSFGVRNTIAGYGGMDSTRQKFTSYERDIETGLDFAQARYFSNLQGRFTSTDPLMASGRVWNPVSVMSFSPC